MKNILIANQKGGVGKSLIADELAFSFERSGIPFNFYDLDGQGGVIHQTKQTDGAEISVIDTPGAPQQSLRDWIDQADVIIIPTRATSRDIEPLQRMQQAVQKAQEKGVPVLYVINGFNRFRASSDFLEWFKQSAEKDQIFTLPQSEQIVQAFPSASTRSTAARRVMCGSYATLSGSWLASKRKNKYVICQGNISHNQKAIMHYVLDTQVIRSV